MTGRWQLRSVPLRFQIGDWTLFSVPLRLHSRSLSLSDRAAPEADPSPPADPGLGAAAGYMVRAQPVQDELPTFAHRGGFIRYVTLQYRHCYVDLGIGLEAYRQKFSAKTRSTISRKVRRFQDHCGGELRWRVFKTPEDMPAFHALARQVSAKTYQERLLDAGIPDDADFVEDMKRRSQRNEVRAFILFDAETPVAYLYCPAQDGVLIYAYLGYDPAYMKLSVGTVLQWLAFEHLFEEAQFELFDFTEGQSDHKRLFATHDQRCANLMFVRASAWHAALLRAHAGLDRLSGAAGRLAERWGLKARLRRVLRFGLAAPT